MFAPIAFEVTEGKGPIELVRLRYLEDVAWR
jgi:hypothetical protein